MTTFSFTGVVQTWTVPTTGWWSFTAWGGSGGDFHAYPGTWDESGGLAQTVTGRVHLTAGTDIDIWVGGAGHDSSRPGFPSDGSGGWSKTGYHGGACGSPSPQAGHAAGGGGATVVELPSGLLLVAGAAGGAGLRGNLATRCSGGWSGHGLAPAGESGDGYHPGDGGSASTPGAGGTSAGGTNGSAASSGTGGQGGFYTGNGSGGGGGGGYQGGGGGGAAAVGGSSGGGGGGGSWWDSDLISLVGSTGAAAHREGGITFDYIAAGGWSVGFLKF